MHILRVEVCQRVQKKPFPKLYTLFGKSPESNRKAGKKKKKTQTGNLQKEKRKMT